MDTFDSSWDFEETESGNTPHSEDAFHTIYTKWQQRSWETWLKENLTFPFFVKRVDDEDDAYFTDIADHEAFRLGHEMKIVDIEMEDDLCGIIVKAREGRRIGYVPLCDVEVPDKEDINYWPVREYLVWFANR